MFPLANAYGASLTSPCPQARKPIFESRPGVHAPAAVKPLASPTCMKCIIVSHTHWDREWYRTFQAFRARLVDMIDRVLELVESDAGFPFLLDGPPIVLDDYLEIRPERRDALIEACRAGRIAIGPWYVQPDSLLPSGEA